MRAAASSRKHASGIRLVDRASRLACLGGRRLGRIVLDGGVAHNVAPSAEARKTRCARPHSSRAAPALTASWLSPHRAAPRSSTVHHALTPCPRRCTCGRSAALWSATLATATDSSAGTLALLLRSRTTRIAIRATLGRDANAGHRPPPAGKSPRTARRCGHRNAPAEASCSRAIAVQTRALSSGAHRRTLGADRRPHHGVARQRPHGARISRAAAATNSSHSAPAVRRREWPKAARSMVRSFSCVLGAAQAAVENRAGAWSIASRARKIRERTVPTGQSMALAISS